MLVENKAKTILTFNLSPSMIHIHMIHLDFISSTVFLFFLAPSKANLNTILPDMPNIISIPILLYKIPFSNLIKDNAVSHTTAF